jgi:hypothetical protein
MADILIRSVTPAMEALETRHTALVVLLAERIESCGSANVLANLSIARRYADRLDLATAFQVELVYYAEILGWPAVFVALAQAWPSVDRHPRPQVCQ